MIHALDGYEAKKVFAKKGAIIFITHLLSALPYQKMQIIINI
jgi:hypothetical protein